MTDCLSIAEQESIEISILGFISNKQINDIGRRFIIAYRLNICEFLKILFLSLDALAIL